MKMQLPNPNAQQTQTQPDDGWAARGHIRFGLICVILLAGGLGGWSATAKLAGAVIASGQIRVEAQRQVVQHPDGGVVGEIQVRNGDVVGGGEVLIRLDDTTLKSELTVLESQLFEVMARRDRLLAEQFDLPEVKFRPILFEISEERPDIQTLIDGQRNLFDARIQSMESELAVMAERRTQLNEQIQGAEAEQTALRRQSELIEQELVGMRQLAAKGLATQDRILSLEREAARLLGQIGQILGQIGQLKGQISELKTEELRMADTRREEAITQERELGYRELELTERRIALLEQLNRLEIRAPRPGVVHDMTVFALKSVIRPAEPILYVVPSDTDMVVDARVEPLHRDQVSPAQDVVLRFSAFNTRTTPELFGRVSKVSSDTLLDEASGLTYFSAEVVLNEGEIDKLAGAELVAGMPVEVYIQTGERTPINYLMRPITDYFSRSLREE
ncbi:MAG: HlyD family type I secretion periplasmic adaptor subunit [Pseudomonadota bacterium]